MGISLETKPKIGSTKKKTKAQLIQEIKEKN